MADYGKQRIALRYWLLGAGYTKGAEAMTFAESYHSGLRKDKVTAEFAHQVQIASMVRSLLPYMSHPEDTMCAALLHDVVEDYDVSLETIRDRFGARVAAAVDCLSKEVHGQRRDDKWVFERIAQDEIASLVKLCDRHHNLGSLLGVFTTLKVERYLAETKEIMGIIKVARTRFPHAEPAYELMKLCLQTQVDMLSALVTSTRLDPVPPTMPIPRGDEST